MKNLFATLALIFALAVGAFAQVQQKAMVTIEFDDGFASAHDIAYPIMDNAGFGYDACIVNTYLNTPKYMTTSDLLNWDNGGTNPKHEVCAHTKHHYDLDTVTPATIYDEIQNGKTDLEAIVGHKVLTFAYPFGHHGGNYGIGVTLESGFESAGTVYGTVNPTSTPYVWYNEGITYGTNPMILPRFPMVNNTTESYAQSLVNYAINHKVWIIILFHRVDEYDSNGQLNSISVTSRFVQDTVNYIQSKGSQIQVVSRTQGLAALGLTQVQK